MMPGNDLFTWARGKKVSFVQKIVHLVFACRSLEFQKRKKIVVSFYVCFSLV